MLEKFIELLEREVKNHSIYVWGGNGETAPIVCEEWIRKKETSAANADRAIKTYHKAVSAGYGEKLRAFDCSGLGYYCLKEIGLQKTDLTANALKGKCTLISKGELKKGCFVFKTYRTGASKGNAYHIGYVVDDELNVIEAQGRDEGVVKRALKVGGWNTYGLPSYFAEEILADESGAQDKYIFTRILKNTSPRMKGEDVSELQKLLVKKGYSCGSCGIDGSFGDDSEKAVREFQKCSGLTVDGKAGENTITRLGGVWRGKQDQENQNNETQNPGQEDARPEAEENIEAYVFTRVLKNTSPRMKGEDVSELQKLLVKKGYSCGSCGIDGSFGDDSEKAVREFQKCSGLTVDGKAGENTIPKLGGIWKENKEPQKIFAFTRILKKKALLMRGEDVKILQQALNQRGYDCGKIDGAYGSKTKSAVSAFQKSSGLTVDGITGKNTVTTLGYRWNG